MKAIAELAIPRRGLQDVPLRRDWGEAALEAAAILDASSGAQARPRSVYSWATEAGRCDN
eukprot:9479776-Pyramimonas_sp.AAC.1